MDEAICERPQPRSADWKKPSCPNDGDGGGMVEEMQRKLLGGWGYDFLAPENKECSVHPLKRLAEIEMIDPKVHITTH